MAYKVTGLRDGVVVDMTPDPMWIMRVERDIKLKHTDWWAAPDRTMTDAEKKYRQDLRDMPETNPDIAFNDDGDLINVTWPTNPNPSTTGPEAK